MDSLFLSETGHDIVISRVITSPAPRKTNLLSPIFFSVILLDAKIPATATAAVPCMSSLNVQNLFLYLSRKRKAL
jgi:hypothetical protein